MNGSSSHSSFSGETWLCRKGLERREVVARRARGRTESFSPSTWEDLRIFLGLGEEISREIFKSGRDGRVGGVESIDGTMRNSFIP